MRVVDYDLVEESNLNRQFLYDEKDVGKPKVKAAKKKLKEVNPMTVVEAINRRITCEENLKDIVERMDFLVCAADFPFHYIYRWVNKTCVKHNIPWIQANFAEATGFVGPLVVPGKTSCYRCIEEIWKKKNPDYLYEIDRLNQDESLYHEKSSTLGATIGILGNLAALEVIKHITGFAPPLTYNCQISIDFGSMSVDKRRFRKVKNCPVCKSRR